MKDDMTRSNDMTNAEAIETLRANYPDACFEQLREAVDAAIEALKTQDVTGDTISRQAALDAITDDSIVANMDSVYDSELHRYKRAMHRIIAKLPSAQPWIPLSTNQLPKEGQQVFIQFKEGRHCPHFKVQVGYLGEHDVEDNNFRKIGTKKVWYTNQYYYDLDMVVAWMPFELYKESENVSITD